MKRKIVEILGNYVKNNNGDNRLDILIKDHFPYGSGFDSGTTLVSATKERIVFQADFHHMNEHGFYDGWTEHRVIITPDLEFGYNIKITGRDKNGIKEYIADNFYNVLNKEIEGNIGAR